MSELQVPGPQIPTGTIAHSALEFFADGGDVNLHADMYVVAGMKVTFSPYIRRGSQASPLTAAVWTTGGGESYTLVPKRVRGIYDMSGRVKLLQRDGTASDFDVRLAATTGTGMVPDNWFWRADWEGNVLPSGDFHLAPDETFDLSALILNATVPGAPTYLEPLLERALALEALIAAAGGELPGGGGATAVWGSIQGQPAVIAAGATQAEARTAIGAGTSSLAIGTTGSTAKAGNYAPPSASSTAAGLVELATTTEATTGTDATRAVTPAGLKTVADTKANQAAGAPGTFYGVRTAAQWAALGAPTGTGPFWGVST